MPETVLSDTTDLAVSAAILPDAAESALLTADGIADPALLFQLSGLVDRVRDTAETLLPADPETAGKAAVRLARTYNEVRTQAAAALTSYAFTFADATTRKLPVRSGVTAAEVFAEASMLAQVFDGLLNTPGFVIKRTIAHAQVSELATRLEGAAAGASVAEVLTASMIGDQSGSYL